MGPEITPRVLSWKWHRYHSSVYRIRSPESYRTLGPAAHIKNVLAAWTHTGAHIHQSLPLICIACLWCVRKTLSPVGPSNKFIKAVLGSCILNDRLTLVFIFSDSAILLALRCIFPVSFGCVAFRGTTLHDRFLLFFRETPTLRMQ